jgi:type VI secretion system protein VasD
MSNIAIRHLRLIGACLATLAIAACGVAQSMKDGTVDAAKWAFTTQVKTMNLDLVSRSSLNTNGGGQSLSTVVRVYQLKDRQVIDQIAYEQLQDGDIDALKQDLLSTTDLVLRPNASASITEPMNDNTEFVAVVAFFRDDAQKSTWRIVVPKKQWKQTDPVKLEVRDSSLALVGKGAPTVKQQATQHSAPKATSAPQPSTTAATQPIRVIAPPKPAVNAPRYADDWAGPG